LAPPQQIKSSYTGLASEAKQCHNRAWKWHQDWFADESRRRREAFLGKTLDYAYAVCACWQPSNITETHPTIEFWTDDQNEERQYAFSMYLKMAIMIRSRYLVPIYFPRAVLINVFTQGQIHMWERVPLPNERHDNRWGGLQYVSFSTACRQLLDGLMGEIPRRLRERLIRRDLSWSIEDEKAGWALDWHADRYTTQQMQDSHLPRPMPPPHFMEIRRHIGEVAGAQPQFARNIQQGKAMGKGKDKGEQRDDPQSDEVYINRNTTGSYTLAEHQAEVARRQLDAQNNPKGKGKGKPPQLPGQWGSQGRQGWAPG
jgi:hypothetical protein